jgi:Phosphotransferase enzyme family
MTDAGAAGDGGGDSSQLRQLAASLCSSAGLPPPTALEGLAGGRNNRVVRLQLPDQRLVVLKCYHHDPRDHRDRLAAEWSFLDYAIGRGVANVPQPLARDVAAHAGLYSHVPGARLSGQATAGHVEQALRFIADVNRAPRSCGALAMASEACTSLEMHLETVERRVRRMDAIAAGDPVSEEARTFATAEVAPAWSKVRAHIEERAHAAGLDLTDTLQLNDMCVSPSDFGFHNALAEQSGRLNFIDFEYAGCDDPAKLVCDFFCQPDVPAPPALFDTFAAQVMQSLDLGEDHLVRARLLLDAYRIKWICIMLNEFLPISAARRNFADPQATASRAALQLAKARAAMASVSQR